MLIYILHSIQRGQTMTPKEVEEPGQNANSTGYFGEDPQKP